MMGSDGPLPRPDAQWTDPQPAKADVTKSTDEAPPVQRNNSLLACLSFAQFRNVDFTGISWVEGQGKLGDGGQASVLQTRADATSVLAFRKHTPQKKGLFGRLYERVSKGASASVATSNEAYRQIASEILALGHPALRSHQNIVQLIAISWEIREEKWPSKTEIWPVLIFEKARYEDLEKFVRDPKKVLRSKDTLSTKNMIKICADVATAMAVMHENNIVHGDVKPQNVLVFGESEETIVAKVADFGFATVASGNKIDVAISTPWVAPEVGSRDDGHTLEQAKKTDVYSFGMLCLWLIFRERLEHMESGIREPGKKYDVASDIEILERWNVADTSANEVQHSALDLVKHLPSDDLRLVVERLFRDTLSLQPDRRSDFTTIARLLQNRASPEDHPHHEVEVLTAPFPTPSDFKVSDALQSLCLADPRVRKGVFYSLLNEYEKATEPKQKSDLAVQLAFCKNIGFGTSKDLAKADHYIDESKTHMPDRNLRKYLEDAIKSTQQKREPCNEVLRKMYRRGVIQPIHNAMDYQSLTEAQQSVMRQARKKEFEDMETSLSTTHPAVLNLKWTYSTLLFEQTADEPPHLGTLKAKCDFLKAIAEDLTSDEAYGENHIDTVMAEAYYTFSLLEIPSFDAIEDSLHKCLRLHQRLRDVGVQDHVITAMICKHLSMCLNQVLRVEEADEYFREAKKATEVIFGADHPNTVLLLLDEAHNYVQQGRAEDAEAAHRKCLKRMLGEKGPQQPQQPLLTEKSKEFLPLQGELVEMLVMSGKFNVAQQELNYAKQLLEYHGFGEEHPAYITAHHLSMKINMELGKFEEADRHAKKLLTIMSREPWPPPTDIVSPDVPHPNLFPQNPNKMLVEGVRSILLVARYHEATAAGKQGLMANLKKEVNSSLTKHLREINKCRGSNGETASNAIDLAPGVGGSGLASSAMYRAMEKELSIPLELLTFLGADNARNGLHYTMAIQVARSLELLWEVAVLEEHQAICSPISPPTDLARGSWLFETLEDLDAWITGNWKGTYLTKGGLRKGLRWKRTLQLRQIKSEEEVGEEEEQPLAPDTLRIRGTADDEEFGEWRIWGSASRLGKMTLNFYLANSGSPKHAWEYAGRVHKERGAFGGQWGIRGHEKNHADTGGSFFFYKI
ncbi:hypothetical protein BDZ45DRAFT_82220 [Acephala macrosclerotiorum]|nr:hypothetical protein BDZ45DRAFT_82220 [Acephala macrosclerotiorum]